MSTSIPPITCTSEGAAHQGAQICCSGGVRDFDRIYQSYRRRVFELCLRMAGNRTEAEDLTQEAFIQLFRKIHTFRGESAFTTWLHRLVVNVVLVRFRKKSLPIISLDNRLDGETHNPKESFGALDTTLISAIDRLNLEIAVAQLPEGFRAVFVLHDVEGYEHNEIARILGVAEGTSNSQLHKARVRLRDLLKSGRIGERRARSGRTGRSPRGSRERPALERMQFSSASACGLPKRMSTADGREMQLSQQSWRGNG